MELYWRDFARFQLKITSGGLNSITPLIRNHIHIKAQAEITYPFPNLNATFNPCKQLISVRIKGPWGQMLYCNNPLMFVWVKQIQRNYLLSVALVTEWIDKPWHNLGQSSWVVTVTQIHTKSIWNDTSLTLKRSCPQISFSNCRSHFAQIERTAITFCTHQAMIPPFNYLQNLRGTNEYTIYLWEIACDLIPILIAHCFPKLLRSSERYG